MSKPIGPFFNNALYEKISAITKTLAKTLREQSRFSTHTRHLISQMARFSLDKSEYMCYNM